MLEGIGNYFKARFIAEPGLDEIRFGSTREFMQALRRAGVPLWGHTDKWTATNLSGSCATGHPLRARIERTGGRYAWVFSRPERLSHD